MREERHQALLLDFLAGNLNKEQQRELNALLASGELQEKELQNLQATYDAFHTLPEPVPGAGMEGRFYSMLAAEKQKAAAAKNGYTWTELWNRLGAFLNPVQFAYTLVVFGLGFAVAWFAFNPKQEQQRTNVEQLATELNQVKQLLFATLIEQPAAVDRLKAVNISQEMPKADSRVIDALFNSLNNDPNVNVRLAAIEALRNHTDQPEVRAGLILSIKKQDSPMVQIALADLMQALQEKNAVPQLRQLLQDEETNELVKDKIKESINILI
jgi:hypothetical protein